MGLTSRSDAVSAARRLKYAPPARLNITFPCTQEDIHTVSFIKGDLFFFNHDMRELKATAVLDRLATPKLSESTNCGCVKLFRFVMDSRKQSEVTYSFFPPSVRDSMEFMERRAANRVAYRRCFVEEPPAAKAVENKFLAMLHKTYQEKLEYRKPTKEGWSNEQNREIDIPIPLSIGVKLGEPDITGFLVEGEKRRFHDKKDDVANVVITVNLKHFGSLYNKGLAVVDGCAVLARLYDFPNNSFLALVGKQTYGYKITKEYAIIHPERNHISWVAEEKAHKILTEGKVPRSRRTKKELGKE